MNDIERARYKRVAKEYMQARKISVENAMQFLKDRLPTAEDFAPVKPFIKQELEALHKLHDGK